MMLQRVFFVILVAFLSLGISAAYATECVVSGPRYRLNSDVVNWSIKIGSGQSCIRGLRFNNVAFESLKLVSPPLSGQVTLQGTELYLLGQAGIRGRGFFHRCGLRHNQQVKRKFNHSHHRFGWKSGSGSHPP